MARDPAFAVVGGDPGATLAQEVERYEPDVVLLEIADPVAGDDALSELHLPFAELPGIEHGEHRSDVGRLGDFGASSVGGRASTPPAVVALVDAPTSSRMAGALRRGIRALLPRTAGAAEILAAVHAVSVGLASLPSAWFDELLGAELPASLELAPLDGAAADAGALDGASSELTPREREVLRMIGEGLANKQIAARLGISSHTVKYHVASVFAKLHASTRAEAVMTGARRGLIVL